MTSLSDLITRANAVIPGLGYDNRDARNEAVALIAGFVALVKELQADRDQWKSNHDEMVTRNRLLRERSDLPVDRLPAMNELVSVQASLTRCRDQLRMVREALTGIAAFDDTGANERLAAHGSYSSFDEPGSVQRARSCLATLDQEAE